MRFLLPIFLSVAFVICSGCSTSAPTKHGITNFRRVDPAVYRSGQPDNNGEGLVYAHLIGVTDIVKLNEESDGSDNAAVLLGVQVHNFPITLQQQLGLDPIDVAALERLVDSLPREGVLIHCKNGWDRTGLFCAIWRVRRDGWSKADAETEMLSLGFHWNTLPGLRYAWENISK